MKKQFLTISLFLLALSATAQSDYQKVRLAFMLNPQVSWMKSDNKQIESGGSYLGYNFGFCLDRFFAPNYAFTTGLTINSTGGELKSTLATSDFPKKYRLKYIDIPWGLKLKTNDAKRTVFYGQFGLNTQINIKAVDGNGDNINKEVGLIDMGYHFGGGIEYSLGGSTYLMFGTQFTNGFMDITTSDSFSDKTILNRLMFQIGMIF
jgi:hypothetical protein